MKITLQNLTKKFPNRNRKVKTDVVAVDNFSFEIPDGKLIGLLGPSGCGKSTTLNMICGLEKATSGKIFFGDDDVTNLPPESRGVGMVFQNYALYPHLTVRQNILFPLENLKGSSRPSKEEMNRRADEAAALVQINELMDRKPSELSGGQQQRVAIARALATNPDVLLCDEATSALDPKTTHAILELIRDINHKMGITVIVITHQMSVVQEICNRVAILEHGAVVEEGEVSAVFSNPKAEATRNLVYPEMTDAQVLGQPGGQRVRIIFNGAPAARTPLLAQMAMQCDIAASILSASTRSVGERVYGYMLLEIPGGPDDLARAVKYLRKTPDVTVQLEVEYAAKEEAE